MKTLTMSLLAVTLFTTAARSGPTVDVNRFQGKWHEIVRSPNVFQAGCVSSTAFYEPQADGSLKVINQCVTRTGKCRTVVGRACVTNPPCNNRLIVSFETPFGQTAQRQGRVNYEVFYISPNYQTAVVGTPGGRQFWILSRCPTVSAAERQRLLNIARTAGFSTRRVR